MLAPIAAEHGLGLFTGDAPTVGVRGLTLGGGVGFMARKFGLTIDSPAEPDWRARPASLHNPDR